jgi:hypothetical protein
MRGKVDGKRAEALTAVPIVRGRHTPPSVAHTENAVRSYPALWIAEMSELEELIHS